MQVCPTGIDIREGLQYDCIACGACIDACDQIMDKMNYPKGLISYTTQNTIEKNPSRILRPRIFIYMGLLSVLVLGFIFGVGGRDLLITDVIRDRNALYRVNSNDVIENAYTLRLINKTDVTQVYRISVQEEGYLLKTWPKIEVMGGAVQGVPVTLQRSLPEAAGAHDIHFIIESASAQVGDEPLSVERSRFFGPEEGQ